MYRRSGLLGDSGSVGPYWGQEGGGGGLSMSNDIGLLVGHAVQNVVVDENH